ncbi:MAG: polymerase [Treponema sp.]|nr:polymerase [Treponema sp.]
MKKVWIAGILIWAAAALDGQTKISISGEIEWERMELKATVTLNLASAGINLPTGRSQAEEVINVEYTSLILPYILALPIDSSDTIEDLINRGESSLRFPSFIADTARKIPPVLSADLTSLSSSYTINLMDIISRLIRHRRAMELPRPLTPIPAAEYSGVIIIASEVMPVHGRNSTALIEPCLFPKIWDTDMNLLYERNILDPANFAKNAPVKYVSESGIFRPTPSGLSPELTEVVGTNPLRVMARGVFGVRPTDPVIAREDALIILSSEANRQLLREGRLAIVLNEKTLKNPFNTLLNTEKKR